MCQCGWRALSNIAELSPWCSTLHSHLGFSSLTYAPSVCKSVATQPNSHCDHLIFPQNSLATPSTHINNDMGRLSTAVASAGVDAGNLPEKIPNISLIDALLPASWSSRSSKKDKVRHAPISHASKMSPSSIRKRSCSEAEIACAQPHIITHFWAMQSLT